MEYLGAKMGRFGDVVMTTVSNKGSHNYYYCTVLDAC